ncbi:MAG: hypothetical protein K2M00_00850 [Muribaculaceae bacterium]|nr:hypothetical protein [Muribaculaceae bacterium]
MKKLFLASALALASLASQAETAYIGDWESTETGSTSSPGDVMPFDVARYGYGYSQLLYTKNELQDKGLYTENADGSIAKAKIQSLTFKMELIGDYYSGQFNSTVYIQNVPFTLGETFPMVGGEMKWFDVDKTCVGHVTSEYYNMYEGYEEIVELTVQFDEENPFIYEGGNILLTFVSEGMIEPLSGEIILPIVFSAGQTQSGAISGDSDLSGTTGNLKNASKELLVLKIDYELMMESAEPSEVEGEPAVAHIGNWESTETGSTSSPGDVMPFDVARYGYGYSQLLYTKNELQDKGLYTENADGSVTKAKIQSLTFKMELIGDYYSGQFNSTVYIQNVPFTLGETFPMVGGEMKWFDVDKTCVGHVTSEYYNMYEGYEEIVELTVQFDEENPFIYEGGNILLTFVSEGMIEPLSGEIILPIVFSAGQTQSGAISGDSDLSDTTGNLKNASKELLVLQIDYTPLKVSGVVNKPTIIVSDPEYDVVATGDGTANNITATFTIEDKANVGTYTVSDGIAIIGTFTGSTFTVNYLPLDKDITISVNPEGSNDAKEGRATIKAEDIAALFAVPTADVVEGKQAMTASYKYDANKMSVNAAAQIHVNTTVPVANIKFSDTGASLLYGSDSNFGDLIPENADNYNNASNLGANNYIAAFVKEGAFTVPVKYGEPMFEEYTGTGNVTVAPTIEFPIAKVQGGGYSLTTSDVKLDFSNKVSQKLTNVVVKFTVSKESVATTRTYPTMMEVDEDDENFIIYATEGHVIKYSVCEYGDAVGEYTEGGNAIEVVALESLKGKRIDYANVNEEGVVDREGQRYFDADGKVLTGIIELSAPELSLVRVTNATGESAIDIAAKFTFDDPSVEHFVYANNVQVGNTLSRTASDFTIHFLQYCDEDVAVKIQSSGTSPSMGWATISAADIKALFSDVAAPTVEPTAQDFHGFYDAVIPEATTMDLTLAAQYTVTAAVPAVDVVFEETGAKSFTASHPEWGEIFSNLFSENVEEGTHTVAFATTIAEAVPVQYGWHDVERAQLPSTIELTPTVVYPIAQVYNYALTENKDWTAVHVEALSFEVLNSVSFNLKEIVEEIDEEKVTREHAKEVVVKADQQNLVIYAPKGHYVEVKIDEAASTLSFKAPAKTEGYSNEGNIAVIPRENIKGKTLSFNTVDPEGNVTPGEYQYTADDNGVSAIYSIEADSFNEDVEYYNLQGVRVGGNLAPGLYIRRQGNSTVKVQVR